MSELPPAPSMADLDAQVMSLDSSKFDEVATLFEEAYKARKIIWHDPNETHAVQLESGEIQKKSRIIRLEGDYCLTPEALGRIQKQGLGHIAVTADALEVLRFEDPIMINDLRAHIQSLVMVDEMGYADGWKIEPEDLH